MSSSLTYGLRASTSLVRLIGSIRVMVCLHAVPHVQLFAHAAMHDHMLISISAAKLINV